MMDRLRLGLVGAGRRGQAHLTTIAGMSELYELVGVCDPSPTNVKRSPHLSGAVYADPRELFEHSRLDAAIIATPPESHHGLAALAAENGVNLLIETPLAPTRAMMDFIRDGASRGGIKVEVGENSWRH